MERYAAIVDSQTNTIQNIIVYTSEAGLAALQMPIQMFTVECTNYPVKIGDTFIDSSFLRDGKPIQRIPTEREEIENLRQQLEITQAALDEILLGGV